jgi:hypothetical protein
MATPVPLTAGFIAVDTTSVKTLQLPLAVGIVGRIVTIKDRTGNAATNNITIQTQGGDTFQDGSTTYKITQPYGTASFVSRPGQWLLQQGSEQIYASSIVTTALFASTLTVSSFASGTFVTPANLISTVGGLGAAGYISSSQLISTVAGLGSAGYISSSQLISTVAGLGSAGYISTLSNVPYISSQQLIASTIYATLAGPTTLVLYNF